MGQRILLVEDAEEVRGLVLRVLRGAGYQVVATASAPGRFGATGGDGLSELDARYRVWIGTVSVVTGVLCAAMGAGCATVRPMRIFLTLLALASPAALQAQAQPFASFDIASEQVLADLPVPSRPNLLKRAWRWVFG